MDETPMKAAAFQLSSGTTLVASIQDETDAVYVLQYPLEMKIGVDSDGFANFKFMRWLPFSDSGFVLLNKDTVEGISAVSKTFLTYYQNQVRKYKALQENLDALLNDPELSDDLDSDDLEKLQKNQTYH